MGISNAMYTGVSGLMANSARVGNISENIANANTVGYRRTFTDFVTAHADAVGASGVRTVQQSEIARTGALRNTQNPTDLAIRGNGFFVVSKAPNDPLESNYMLTRAGAFEPDAQGNLRNAAGLYLSGFRYDQNAQLGAVDRTTFGMLETVNISQFQLEGRPTGALELKGNLPSQQTGMATPPAPFISTAPFVTPLGETDRLQFNWAPTGQEDIWDITVSGPDGDYGTLRMEFNDSGPNAGSPKLYDNITNLATAPANFAFDPATGVATVTVNNGDTPQQVEVNLGTPDTFDGMTGFAGDYTPPTVDGDGSEAGVLTGVEIGQDGVIFGQFSNGVRQALYEIPVAEVDNPDSLAAADGNAYKMTRDAGNFALGRAGEAGAGIVASRSLEGSNVEIAQELTDLIQTQRAYSSNAKIVTTMDEMLDEAMRLKR